MILVDYDDVDGVFVGCCVVCVGDWCGCGKLVVDWYGCVWGCVCCDDVWVCVCVGGVLGGGICRLVWVVCGGDEV